MCSHHHPDLVVRIQSKNRPGYFWAVDEGVEGYLMRDEELFRVIRPSLWGTAGSISFESVLRPGYYIVHRDGEIFVMDSRSYGGNEETFRQEASWLVRKDIFFEGFTSFESVIVPGNFIRHRNRKLKVSSLNSDSDRSDASFLMTDINSGSQVVIVEDAWRSYLGKVVSLESKAEAGNFWQAYDVPQARLGVDKDVFRMVDGLWGSNTISFESTLDPNQYIRSSNGRFTVENRQSGDRYAKDCSFKVHQDKFFDGYVSFESSDKEGQWIKSFQDRNLELDLGNVETYSDNSHASFLLSEEVLAPRPTTTTTTTFRPTTPRREIPCKKAAYKSKL